MSGGTTIVDRLNKLSGKDATTISKAVENLEDVIGGGGSGGGSAIHYATINVPLAPGSATTIDKTYAEIESIRDSGKPLMVRIIHDTFVYDGFAQIIQAQDGRGHYDQVIISRATQARDKSLIVQYVLEIPENTSFGTVFYGYSNDDNDIWSM